MRAAEAARLGGSALIDVTVRLLGKHCGGTAQRSQRRAAGLG
jgi:hypothetical protein